jgi:heat shock protein HtpX
VVYEEISRNKRNTFILIFMFIAVISGLGYIIGVLYGNPYTGLILACVISVISAWTSYYYSDSIVMAVSGAVYADRAMYTQYHLSAEGLALAAGIKPPGVYVIESGAINAFATGRDPDHSAIAITTGAFKKLDKLELEGVIAHEMSHIKNYDILTGTLAVVLVGMVGILAGMINRNIFRSSMRRAGGRNGIVFVVIAIAAAVIAPVVALIINFAVSRQREYLADAQAVLLTRYPKGLVDALVKIKADYAPAGELNSGMENLYFSSPDKMDVENLFSTHPPLEARIERLKGM